MSISQDDWNFFDECRLRSNDLDAAKLAIASAEPGVCNTPLVVVISDHLLLQLANMLQAKPLEDARNGMPLLARERTCYQLGEYVRTVLADGRMNRGPHAPAHHAFNPPDDYESGKPATVEPVNVDSLMRWRDSLADALRRYRVDESSHVESSGKFQGEHIAAVVLWESANCNGIWSEQWSHDGFGFWGHINVSATDCAMWPELGLHIGDVIELHEADNGFVRMTVLRGGAVEDRIAQLDDLTDEDGSH